MSSPAPTLTGSINPFSQVTLNWTPTDINHVVFNANGTYNVPTDAMSLDIYVIGGGQGGTGGGPGSGNGSGDFGGGAGGYASAVGVPPSALTSSVYVEVAAGSAGTGAGGASFNGAPSGGDSWFGGSSGSLNSPVQTYLYSFGATNTFSGANLGGGGVCNLSGPGITTTTATGGNGGYYGAPAGGVSANGGPGGGGGCGHTTGSGAGGVATLKYAGSGGNAGVWNTIQPQNGANYGGGGGGGGVDSTDTNSQGGANGAPGVVIIDEHYPAPSGYNIYRNGVLIGTTAGLTFTDSAPPAGTDVYTVTAIVDGAESAASNPFDATISPGTLATAGAYAAPPAPSVPIMIANIDGIEPRIYRPDDNTTFKSLP